MAGLLPFLAGGVMKGVGEGVAQSGKELREQRLMSLQQQGRMDYLRESDRLATEREDARDERLATRQDEMDQRRAEREDARWQEQGKREDARWKAQAERDDARTARDSGQLSNVVQDDEGNYLGITRGGQAVRTGIKGSVKTDKMTPAQAIEEARLYATREASDPTGNKTKAIDDTAYKQRLRELGFGHLAGAEAAPTPAAAAPGVLPAPRSKADLDALPSGTRYRAPDGSERVKK